VTFALWLQIGHHFSPFRAGLTAVAFSVGAFLTAPVAIPAAQRLGRYVLMAGAALLVGGTALLVLVAHRGSAHVGSWSLVPGLVVAGAGLGLLAVPLVNVALSAVDADVAGEASGVFSTAQQFGGALGVALIGTAFFRQLDHHSYSSAFAAAGIWVAVAFTACGIVSAALPRTAVGDDVLAAGSEHVTVVRAGS